MNGSTHELHAWGHQETFSEVMAEQVRKAPWLLVSLAVHAVAIFLLWNIQWETPRVSVDREMAVERTMEDEQPPELEPEPEEVPKKEEVEQTPVIKDIETREKDREEIPEDVPDDARDESPFDRDAFNSVIGIGGGAGGLGKFKGRFPKKRPRGPMEPPNKHLRQALDWLARHQDEDGKWDADGFMSHCDGEKCTGPGSPIHDVGLTGLALLAFLGDGNTLNQGPFRENVKRGILWLKDQQDDEGLIGEKAGQSFMYSHIIAAIAMCEAFGLSRASLLRRPVQKAINYISQARNPYKAWRYYPRSGDNDSSVTGWAVIALASAQSFKDKGLKVSEDDLKGAVAWFDEMTDPNTGRVGYITRGSPPARPEPLMDKFPACKSESITAVALMARFFAGQEPKKPFVRVAVLRGVRFDAKRKSQVAQGYASPHHTRKPRPPYRPSLGDRPWLPDGP